MSRLTFAKDSVRLANESYRSRSDLEVSLDGYLDMVDVPETGCQVLISEVQRRGGKTLYVAFRGTESVVDALAGIWVTRSYLYLPPQNKVLVHTGILNQFDSIRVELFHLLVHIAASYSEIVFTGHSLGGALATIASLYFKSHFCTWNVHCITFGSPRVGGLRFARMFQRLVHHSTRYVLGQDPVPSMPTRWRFRHVHGLQPIDLHTSRTPSRVEYVWNFFSRRNQQFQDHRCSRYILYFNQWN